MALVHLTLYLTLTSYIHAQIVLVSNYRLPTDITAVYYKLTIEPNLNEFKFCGNLSIKLLVEKPTTKLILNVKDLQLNYNNIHLYDSLGNILKIKSFEENVEYERLFIEPEVPFDSGKYYDIHFKYFGNINDDGIGLYRSSYVVGNQVEWMAVSQLRPVHARRMFPCFDEPSFRAVFSLNIIHHPEYKVVSNMPVQNIERYSDELLLTSFDDTPPIPAFLVGIIISKMEQIDGLAGFSSLATPDKLQSIIYSAEIGPKLAAAMENYIGLQYPLNKTYQVALPRLIPVAMENWGLYNFREEFILYLEGESPTLQKQTAARFSAHEICHAWMGNMVSLGWWDYLWMSEVYAMFYEYNIPHMVDPCWRMNEQLVIDLHQAGLLMDSMPVEPLTTSVLTPTQISNKFGGVTYTKGPAILRMAIHVLEEFNFLKGFQQLLIDNAYKSIPNPETMWTYLEKYKTQKLPASLKDIMSLWTTTSGYPVVNVVVQPHRILLSQIKFSLENDTQDFQPWWIPLTFTTGRECNFEVTKPKDWFKPQKMHEINLSLDEGDWILFNIRSVGFYRVNYNKNNWNNLINQLNKNCSKFPAVNRAQLIDDSFNLARSGKLDYNSALTLASYLIYETDFIPWKAAINALDFLDNVLLNSSLRSILKAYIKDLVNNVYLAIGFEEKECDGHVDKINREQIVKLGCESGHHHCIENAKRFVSSLISGYQPKISADVYETVICSAVYNGGKREWEYVLSLYESAASRRKSFYLSILGCSNDPDIIRRYITDNLEALTTEQWMERFRAFSNRKENVNFMLQILYEKYDSIVAKINRKNFVSLLKTMENFFTTEEQLRKIIEFESNNITGVSDIKIKLQKTIQWLNKNLPQLSVFFNNDRTYQLVFSN